MNIETLNLDNLGLTNPLDNNDLLSGILNLNFDSQSLFTQDNLTQHHSLPHLHEYTNQELNVFNLGNQDHINHHTLKSSYSEEGGRPQIFIKDDVIYRHNLDGSDNKIGIVTHDENRHYIYSCDGGGYKDRLLCNVDFNGNIHSQHYTIADYMGHIASGKIYNSDNNIIGYADTNIEGAAHLLFIGK